MLRDKAFLLAGLARCIFAARAGIFGKPAISCLVALLFWFEESPTGFVKNVRAAQRLGLMPESAALSGSRDLRETVASATNFHAFGKQGIHNQMSK